MSTMDISQMYVVAQGWIFQENVAVFFKAQTLWVDLVHGEVLYEVSK